MKGRSGSGRTSKLGLIQAQKKRAKSGLKSCPLIASYLCKRGGLVQRVAGDGQEDVEEGVVAKQRQQHEVETIDHAPAEPATLNKGNVTRTKFTNSSSRSQEFPGLVIGDYP